MPEIKALFWDLGGVLLSNAWDRTQRAQALQKFQLDEIEFHDRHEMLVSSFERGKIALEEYLDRTVFYRERPFTRDQFKSFMYSLSQPDAEALALPLEQLSSGMCHFPFGAVAPFRFCGRATPSDAEPYCQKHYRLTHNQHRGDYDDAL